MFTIRLSLISGLMCFISGFACQNGNSVSFDTLFAPTPYKTVVNQCMRVRNAVLAMHESLPSDDGQYHLAAEVAAGRIALLNMQLFELLTPVCKVSIDDMHYLNELIYQLNTETDSVVKKSAPDALYNYLLTTARSIKKTVERAI